MKRGRLWLIVLGLMTIVMCFSSGVMAFNNSGGGDTGGGDTGGGETSEETEVVWVKETTQGTTYQENATIYAEYSNPWSNPVDKTVTWEFSRQIIKTTEVGGDVTVLSLFGLSAGSSRTSVDTYTIGGVLDLGEAVRIWHADRITPYTLIGKEVLRYKDTKEVISVLNTSTGWKKEKYDKFSALYYILSR